MCAAAEAPVDKFAVAIVGNAEKQFKAKNWEAATKFYDQYFTRSFKADNPVSVQDAIYFLHYGIALVNKVEGDGKVNHYDAAELESATEYLLTSRETLMNSKDDKVNVLDILDAHEYLGKVCLMNNQFKNAASEYRAALAIIGVHPEVGWRVHLSFLYLIGTAYESSENPKEGIEYLKKGIEICNGIIEKPKDDEEKNLADEFKKSIESRMKDMEEDLVEQEANKEDLQPEEEEHDEAAAGEEEEIEEEEEEIVEEETEPKPETKEIDHPETEKKAE